MPLHVPTSHIVHVSLPGYPLANSWLPAVIPEQLKQPQGKNSSVLNEPQAVVRRRVRLRKVLVGVVVVTLDDMEQQVAVRSIVHGVLQ